MKRYNIQFSKKKKKYQIYKCGSKGMSLEEILNLEFENYKDLYFKDRYWMHQTPKTRKYWNLN